MVLRLFSRASDSKDGSQKATKKASSSDRSPASASAGLSESPSPQELAEAARASSARERASLIARIQEPAVLESLADLPGALVPCADALADSGARDTALALASSPQRRLELTLGTHNAQLRDALLDHFASESELVELERTSRSKNKVCNRAARAALEDLKQARTATTNASVTAGELAAAATKLPEDEHIEARYQALAQKHDAAAKTHASNAEVLRRYTEEVPALTPMPAPPVIEPVTNQEQGPDFKALAERFDALSEQLRGGSKASDLTDAYGQAGAAWREAIAKATPNAGAIDAVANSTERYEKLLGCEGLLDSRAEDIQALLDTPLTLAAENIATLQRNELPAAWTEQAKAMDDVNLIRSLSKGISPPTDCPSPAQLTAMQQHAQQANALIAACKDRVSQLENDFKKQVDRLGEALDAGELKRAEAARGEARALQEVLPGGSANVTRKRFGALIGNMQNLRDWQHFATDPKREELCAQMSELAKNPLEPEDQATQVKALREQWNALGGKGPKEVAETFDKLAAEAFEPCRLHYAQLAETRKANLALRKTILESLESFVSDTNWAEADLGAARTILNSARTEWRNAFPVERGPNRALEKRFKATTDELYSHLQEGWSGNLADKEKLVEAAEALLSSEDPLPAKLDAAKRLQQDWKKTGPAPRGPDQKLWKRFRAACDELFNSRDQERQAAQADHAANQVKANARLDEFAAELEASDPATIERSMLNNLKRDMDTIERLDRSVLTRARELEDAFQQKLNAKSVAKRATTLQNLLAADQQAASAELAGETLSDDIRNVAACFSKRASAKPGMHLDLVLAAETQADIESPAEDAQRRLELKVQALNAGMNSGARKSVDALEWAEQWCALQASEDLQPLRDRLFAAARKML